MVGGIPRRWQGVLTPAWHLGVSLSPFPRPTFLGMYGCPFSTVSTMKCLPFTPCLASAATMLAPYSSSSEVDS